MTPVLSFPPRAPRMPLAAFAALAMLVFAVLGVRALLAQVEGERGIAPVAASSDIDVRGVVVDVTGESAEDARDKGWREAIRKAWKKAGGPEASDGQLQSLVTAVVVEEEQVSGSRYKAKLGVIFDRGRAGALLGAGDGQARSAPMLLVPVMVTGGTALVYEMRNPWQRAWAEFQSGASRIDYVRPTGAGGDSLLLTYGQIGRRSRTWWRNILDQFGAADLIVAIARLDYKYPGGPVHGEFTARYGPDNRYLGSFELIARNDKDLERMLAEAVTRFDAIYANALAEGKLTPDPTLSLAGGEMDPTVQRLIELGRSLEAQEQADAARAREAARAARAAAASASENGTTEPDAASTPAATTSSYIVQFASPEAGAVDATLAAVRATPGVRGAATTSLAIGGTSVMSVTYGGSLAELAAALRGRGFSVTQGSNALSISR